MDKNGYAYKVEKKTETAVPVEPAVGESNVSDLPEEIPEEAVDAVKEAAGKYRCTGKSALPLRRKRIRFQMNRLLRSNRIPSFMKLMTLRSKYALILISNRKYILKIPIN